jgi:hypothetical protein
MATSKYRVGDRVKVKLGKHSVVVTVIEDRGALGRNGEQIVRVVENAPDLSSVPPFEISASLVRPA